jgi:hypothetical protein
MTKLFHFPNQLSNQTLNQEANKIESTYLSIVVIVHAFIILLAIVGNSLVIYLVIFNIKLRNVRNAFMVNLTLSNLLLATVCTPWFLITLIYPSWILNDLWCKISNSIPIVIILVSAFSIMMISIDRWMFVVFSRSRQFKSKEATIIIIFIWLLAIVLAAPMFYNRHTQEQLIEDLIDAIRRSSMHYNSQGVLIKNITNISNNNNNKDNINHYISNLNNISFLMNNQININNNNNNTLINYDYEFYSKTIGTTQQNYCVESWANPSHKRIYILILFGLEFVLPCLCMLVTYIWIIQFLKIQHDRMTHYEMLRKKLIQKERPHQKNCKLLSSLCLTFIVCCLPLSLFNIITDFIVDTQEKQHVIYWPLTILTTLELLNTVLSPLLYGWMNHNFRNEINLKLSKFKKKYKKVNMADENDKMTRTTNDHRIKIMQYPLKTFDNKN